MTEAAGPSFPSQPPPTEPPQPPAPPTNGLGIAGFVVSLVGLLPCGLLCPVGLVMSLFALRREPRGFAIAGAVIGGLGTLFAVVVGVTAAMVFLGVKEGLKGGGAAAETVGPLQTVLALSEAQQAIELEKAEKGRVPTAEQGAALIAELRDGWKHALRYETSGDSYTVRSAGPDGEFGNADDETFEGR